MTWKTDLCEHHSCFCGRVYVCMGVCFYMHHAVCCMPGTCGSLSHFANHAFSLSLTLSFTLFLSLYLSLSLWCQALASCPTSCPLVLFLRALVAVYHSHAMARPQRIFNPSNLQGCYFQESASPHYSPLSSDLVHSKRLKEHSWGDQGNTTVKKKREDCRKTGLLLSHLKNHTGSWSFQSPTFSVSAMLFISWCHSRLVANTSGNFTHLWSLSLQRHTRTLQSPITPASLNTFRDSPGLLHLLVHLSNTIFFFFN